MRDLAEGVLEDEREQEVSRRQPKRVFQARAGRRPRAAVVLKWQREGYCQAKLTQNWTEQLFCLTQRVSGGALMIAPAAGGCKRGLAGVVSSGYEAGQRTPRLSPAPVWSQ